MTTARQLSVCIPVYQQLVHKLVYDLQRQLQENKLRYEILLFDDGSEEAIRQENRKLKKLPDLVYREMKENLGRSRIRNVLSQEAQGEFVLFLDNDSAIIKHDFIAEYWLHRQLNGVLCGGRIYPDKAPAGKELHHCYGRKREVKRATQRNKKPFRGFQSNNFFVHRAVLESVQFDERLQQYGHEDTLFGLSLAREFSLLHLNNPVLHADLESNASFLNKTRQGLENLCLIVPKLDEAGQRYFPLYRLAQRAKKNRSAGVWRQSFKIMRGRLERNLLSSKPRLPLFDVYRMGYLLTEMKRRDL